MLTPSAESNAVTYDCSKGATDLGSVPIIINKACTEVEILKRIRVRCGSEIVKTIIQYYVRNKCGRHHCDPITT